MCHIVRDVYTVCAHTKAGGLVECEAQRARNEQWLESSWCAAFRLALQRCVPADKTRLKYWFCRDCREFYRGHDTNTVDAVLNYWAVKNFCGYSFSVLPGMVPAALVFGRLTSDFLDPKLPRCELIALDKALPRVSFETPAKWLQRLEAARTTTLTLAEEWSLRVSRRQARGAAAGSSAGVVRMQPRITTPMSVYPYAPALTSVTELNEPEEEIIAEPEHQQQDARPPPPQDTIVSPQVHTETLQRLCGEVQPAVTHASNLDPSAVVEAPHVSAPVGHEVTSEPGPRTTAPVEDARTSMARPLMVSRLTTVQDHEEDHLQQSLAEPVEPEQEPAPAAIRRVESSMDIVEAASVTGVSMVIPEPEEANMLSHFSVSDIDPEDAAALAADLSSRPVSEDFEDQELAALQALRKGLEDLGETDRVAPPADETGSNQA